MFKDSLKYGVDIYKVVQGKREVTIPILVTGLTALLDLAMQANDMLQRLAAGAIGNPTMSKTVVNEAVSMIQASKKLHEDLGRATHSFHDLTGLSELRVLVESMGKIIYGEDEEKAAG